MNWFAMTAEQRREARLVQFEKTGQLYGPQWDRFFKQKLTAEIAQALEIAEPIEKVQCQEGQDDRCKQLDFDTDEGELSYAQIGRVLSISGERVRQIEKRALYKLRQTFKYMRDQGIAFRPYSAGLATGLRSP